jgi:hypothetical protein
MMLNAYLTGCVSQLEIRVRELRTRIPRRLPRDYDTLAQACRDRLDGVLAVIRILRDDAAYQLDVNQPERLRMLKRAVADLDLLETSAVAALVRATEDDHRLNQLLEQIAREIDYPLVTPVVTTLSQQYFYIHPDLRLLAVPLVEGRFLLHLPDLYHELAHPLLLARDEPQVESLQAGYAAALSEVLTYLHEETTKEGRRRGPSQSAVELQLWRMCWIRFWLTEFFCDMFAVLTLGPAFAWSHLHLSVMRGGDPYHVPSSAVSSHPADDARMRVMLAALGLAGFGAASAVIAERWEALLRQACAKAEPEYRRCFPARVISAVATHAMAGVRGMKCRFASPVPIEGSVQRILNEAWERFWAEPAEYALWEKSAITSLLGEPIHG